MQAYSADLRERVAAAYATGEFTIGQVASRFAVSVSFVDKLLKRQRTSGSVAALPHRGGPAPRLQEADRQRLAACVAAQPDATLAELRQHLVAAGSPAVGQTVLWQTLQQLDLQRKKEFARRRARHRTGEAAAPGVYRSSSARRQYAFQVCG